jgi:hypothetical protein
MGIIDEAPATKIALHFLALLMGSFCTGLVICFISTRKTYLHFFFAFVVTAILVLIQLITSANVYFLLALPILVMGFVCINLTVFVGLICAYRFFTKYIRKDLE